MKKLLVGLLSLVSLSTFASVNGTVNCKLTLDNQDQYDMKISFNKKNTVISVEGEDLGYVSASAISAGRYELSAVSDDYTQSIELQFKETDFSTSTSMVGRINVGEIIEGQFINEMLYVDFTAICSPIK